MARKPPSKPASNAGHMPAENDVQDALEAQVLQRIETQFGETEDAEWDVKVYKVVDAPGRKGGIVGWIFDCDVMDLKNVRAKLASEEGPGRFRITVAKDGVKFGQYDVYILRDLRPKATPAAQSAPAAVPGDGMTPFERAMLAMMDRQDQRFALLMERMAAPRDNAISNMEQMATVLKSVREIAGPENTGLQMFREGIQFAKEMIPKDAGGGGIDLAGLAMSALDKLPSVLETLQRGQQTQAAAPARQPQPLPAPRAPAPAGNSAIVDTQAQFQQLKEFLLQKAIEGAEPSLYADYVVRQLGEAGLTVLEQADDPLDFLVTQFPDLAPHRAWFAALIKAMESPEDDAARTEPVADVVS